MSFSERMMPMPRTSYDCSPIVSRWPPTFWLAFDSALTSWVSVTPCPLRR